MPGGDGTGPMGWGPMTGRAAGFCAGFGVPGYANPALGRGFWRGFGRGLGRFFGRGGGRGWRHWYYATGLPGWYRAGSYPVAGTGFPSGFYRYPGAGYPWAYSPGESSTVPATQQELGFLKNQAQYFQEALKEINERILELEKAKPAEE